MNITDVGHLAGDGDMGMDKIEEAARAKNMNAYELSEFYTRAFQNDVKSLNMLQPDIWEKATNTITEQVSLIKKLEEKGFTYKISDGIYFNTSKFLSYGAMSTLDPKGIKETARIDKNPERKNPRDFALWKFNKTGKPRQMEWDSPWGVGFPGWHIECSAISIKYLGAPFDIHTGGVDHLPTHHPNEIAQTECALGVKMANYWLHGEHLVIDSKRMGKSVGNFVTLRDVINKGFDPPAYRYFLYSAHYRQQLNFTWGGLESAQTALGRIENYVTNALESTDVDENVNTEGLSRNKDISEIQSRSEEFKAKYSLKFVNAISDDLNMPRALAVVWEMLGEAKKVGGLEAESLSLLFDWDSIFGLGLNKAQNSRFKVQEEIPEKIMRLIKEREKARKSKDFATADKLRKDIEKLGYKIEDFSNGTRVVGKK